MNAIKQAADILGSQKALAEALGVTSGAISQWQEGRVPFEHCIRIEQLTNGVVRCEALRPDIDWHYLRATDCPVIPADEKLAA